MSPTNKKYEVVQAFELQGAIQEVGAILELSEEDAKHNVETGILKEVPEPTEEAAPSQEAPSETKSTDAGVPLKTEEVQEKAPSADTVPEPKEESKPWAGNHVVGGNEINPHKGGSLRTPHPDLRK